MPPPSRSNKDSESASETPSNNLWVGNLSTDTTESELMDLFGRFGALYVTTYSSRSYAFVFFKRVEDSKSALEALQGTVVRGSPMKIQFTRPAKPCKQLWVGGISPNVSKEQLEEEFIKFGKIEDFKFLRDRNTAFIEYFRLDDASQAMKNMNGKRIGGDQIRVDFLRSQPLRREQGPDIHDLRDRQFTSRSTGPDTHSGTKRQQHSQPSGMRKGEGQPSKVLWIGYPPSIQIDEQMLHNAMILFGEIENIKSFPSRHYSFVEFRSVDEARCAKEGLQGRLFNDPRITIMFSSSELAPGKDYSGLYSGMKDGRPEMFFNEHQFRPAHMDMIGQNHPMVLNNFPGSLPLGGVLGSNIPMRPFGPRGGFEPPLSGPEYNDLSAHSNLPDGNLNNLMGPNWRRPSPPAPGMLPSPASGIKPSLRPVSGPWEVFDANQFQRDSKRSRIDGAFSSHDASFPLRKIDDRGLGLDQLYGLGPVIEGGASGPFASSQGKSHRNPVGSMVTSGGRGQGHIDNDFIWRGIIAKGGNSVCHARCVPIGKGIESDLPAVVNCSARTGLDMLTKHYDEAIGFEIVFFLPDSEDDFDSYTEFLRYLGGRDRAGVAKLDDGTTLFLVPPSEFLTKVLKIVGPERLYGVVLKLPQVPSSPLMQQQAYQPTPSQYLDRHYIPPSQDEYGLTPTKEEQVLPMDYNGVLHEDSKFPKKLHLPDSNESVATQSVPQDYTFKNTAAVPQSGVSLTPELIASLASILPSNTQSQLLGSSPLKPSFPPSGAPDRGIPSQVWKHKDQASEHAGHILQQLGNQFSSQAQPYQPLPATTSHPENMTLGGAQSRDSSVNLPHQGAISSRALPNVTIPSQNGQFAISQQIGQHYQPEVPINTQKGYGMAHGTDSSGLYGSAFQQPNESDASSTLVPGANLSQTQNVVSSSVDNSNVELTNKVQQLQPVDKNQRYQSTLQLAASLLLQVQQQQQQQQTSSPAGRGSANQQ